MNCVSASVPRVCVSGVFSSLFSIRATQRASWTNQLKYRSVGVLVLFAALAFLPRTGKAAMLLSIDYDNGSFGSVTVRPKQPGTDHPSLCCKHSAQIVTRPARSGSKAVKMTLLPMDEGYVYGKYNDPYVRAEFEKHGLAYRNLERWFAFSVYIDPSYTSRTDDRNGVVISQWGVLKDACDKDSRPPLMIRYMEAKQKWYVYNAFDRNACSTTASITNKRFVVGTATKGVWTDWVVNVRWSSGADGFLKIWKDGHLVVNTQGPNVLNHQKTEMLWKWGLYKSHWRNARPSAEDKLVAYFDEINIGDTNSNYAQVALKRSSSPILAAPESLSLITNTD